MCLAASSTSTTSLPEPRPRPWGRNGGATTRCPLPPIAGIPLLGSRTSPVTAHGPFWRSCTRWRPASSFWTLQVKVQGEFTWHTHQDTDELFLVTNGQLTITMRDGSVTLGPGQLFVVPCGVEHCPATEGEAHALLIEPTGVVNTGDAGGSLTAATDDCLA
jgi:mannose-6-phosphate isomerase-like protein (cupin superfamily)